MVQQGLAPAYRRYSLDYVNEEAGAQAARRGIRASEFVKP
jgi:endonuclease YncB( thermonuclease family)